MGNQAHTLLNHCFDENSIIKKCKFGGVKPGDLTCGKRFMKLSKVLDPIGMLTS